jgi:hypothetical protein
MKYVIRKAYWDFEKEEAWLNQMAAKGMALIDYSWCRYLFEDCKNGEYIYRIELLENLPSHPESQAYIRFMEESGVECVATYARWIYFRKKAADGPFDIYSDRDSMITHYKRINALWITLAVTEILVGMINVLYGIWTLINGRNIGSTNIGASILVLSLGVFFLVMALKTGKKIKKLMQEKLIRE